MQNCRSSIIDLSKRGGTWQICRSAEITRRSSFWRDRMLEIYFVLFSANQNWLFENLSEIAKTSN